MFRMNHEFIIFMLTLVLSALGSTAFADTAGTFTVVKGDVQVTSANGATEKARVGKKVIPSDIITAGKDSRAKIIMVDKNVINISPETKMSLEKYIFNPEANDKQVTLNILYGKVRATVEQKYDGEKNKFHIKTPAAVAGVRGTDFLTSYSLKTNETKIVTFEGRVAVGTPGPKGQILNPVLVTPGQFTTTKVGGTPSAPVALPAEEFKRSNSESQAEPVKQETKSNDSKGNTGDESKEEKKADDQKSDTKKESKSEGTDDTKNDKSGNKKEATSENGSDKSAKNEASDDGSKGKNAEGQTQNDSRSPASEKENSTASNDKGSSTDKSSTAPTSDNNGSNAKQADTSSGSSSSGKGDGGGSGGLASAPSPGLPGPSNDGSTSTSGSDSKPNGPAPANTSSKTQANSASGTSTMPSAGNMMAPTMPAAGSMMLDRSDLAPAMSTGVITPTFQNARPIVNNFTPQAPPAQAAQQYINQVNQIIQNTNSKSKVTVTIIQGK